MWPFQPLPHKTVADELPSYHLLRDCTLLQKGLHSSAAAGHAYVQKLQLDDCLTQNAHPRRQTYKPVLSPLRHSGITL